MPLEPIYTSSSVVQVNYKNKITNIISHHLEN